MLLTRKSTHATYPAFCVATDTGSGIPKRPRTEGGRVGRGWRSGKSFPVIIGERGAVFCAGAGKTQEGERGSQGVVLIFKSRLNLAAGRQGEKLGVGVGCVDIELGFGGVDGGEGFGVLAEEVFGAGIIGEG